jgi:hypothetical protein
MTLVTVAFYDATVIYFHRSRLSPFGALPVRQEVQEALSELFNIARLTVQPHSVQLLERFQWSMFIAGTETNDYGESKLIQQSLSDPVLKDILPIVQEMKEKNHGCIDIAALRLLFAYNESNKQQ